MIFPTPVSTSSLAVTVGAANVTFGATMAANQFWVLISSTACWFKQGTAPVASAASGSMYLPANTPVYLDGAIGVDVGIIQDTTGGKASLTRVKTL